MIRAYARIKNACAETNRELGRLPEEKTQAIVAACDEVLAGRLTRSSSSSTCTRRAPEPRST